MLFLSKSERLFTFSILPFIQKTGYTTMNITLTLPSIIININFVENILSQKIKITSLEWTPGAIHVVYYYLNPINKYVLLALLAESIC